MSSNMEDVFKDPALAVQLGKRVLERAQEPGYALRGSKAATGMKNARMSVLGERKLQLLAKPRPRPRAAQGRPRRRHAMPRFCLGPNQLMYGRA